VQSLVVALRAVQDGLVPLAPRPDAFKISSTEEILSVASNGSKRSMTKKKKTKAVKKKKRKKRGSISTAAQAAAREQEADASTVEDLESKAMRWGDLVARPYDQHASTVVGALSRWRARRAKQGAPRVAYPLVVHGGWPAIGALFGGSSPSSSSSQHVCAAEGGVGCEVVRSILLSSGCDLNRDVTCSAENAAAPQVGAGVIIVSGRWGA